MTGDAGSLQHRHAYLVAFDDGISQHRCRSYLAVAGVVEIHLHAIKTVVVPLRRQLSGCHEILYLLRLLCVAACATLAEGRARSPGIVATEFHAALRIRAQVLRLK